MKNVLDNTKVINGELKDYAIALSNAVIKNTIVKDGAIIADDALIESDKDYIVVYWLPTQVKAVTAYKCSDGQIRCVLGGKIKANVDLYYDYGYKQSNRKIQKVKTRTLDEFEKYIESHYGAWSWKAYNGYKDAIKIIKKHFGIQQGDKNEK